MNRVIKAKLAELGITTERYYLDGDYDSPWDMPDGSPNWKNVPVWGLAIKKDGERMAVIESTTDSYDNKFHLRKSERGIDLGVYKTQREAISGWLRRHYRIAA